MNVTHSILKKIHARPRGWVFTPKEFASLGSRAAIDQTLSRLQRSGEIRRITQGVYEFPRVHPRIGVLSANPESVAKAVAAKTGSRIMVSEAQAANLLGLSTQVPAKNVFLTEGPSRILKVGNQTVTLKHVAPSKLLGAGTEAGVVILAIRGFGARRAHEIPAESLAERLSPQVKHELKRLASSAPVWSQPILNRIAA